MRCRSPLLKERRYWLLAFAVPVCLHAQRVQALRWALLCAWLARWFVMRAARIAGCEESAAWLAALQRAGRSTSTVDAYRSDLACIAATVEHTLGHPAVVTSLCLIGQAEVNKMQLSWSGEGIARATCLRRFATLRGFAKFLSLSGHNCSGILSAELPLPQRLPPLVAPEEVVQQILEPISDSWITERDTCLAQVLIETGATGAEIVAVDCSHVFWEVGGLALAGGTSAARLAPVSDEALSALKAYRNRSPFGLSDAGPLFLNRNGARLYSLLSMRARISLVCSGRGFLVAVSKNT
jgi:site-specific recombinase XerC